MTASPSSHHIVQDRREEGPHRHRRRRRRALAAHILYFAHSEWQSRRVWSLSRFGDCVSIPINITPFSYKKYIYLVMALNLPKPLIFVHVQTTRETNQMRKESILLN